MNMTQDELRALIVEGAFELYGQPKWTFGKNTCNTYEVFPDVVHLPGGETVPGYDCIRQITTNEQTTKMFSEWFLDESLGLMKRLIDQTGCDLITAINNWACDINQPDYVERVMASLDRHGLSPRNLEFELSDVDALNDVGMENLKVLKESGVRLLLDNFGVGNSNLFLLNKLPFDGIKLDKCFAVGVPTDEKLVRMLVSIAHMADTLGITVCAKGIENGDQMEYFSDLGFYKGQGYMIGRPLPEEALREFITHFAKMDNVSKECRLPDTQSIGSVQTFL